jgi:hypothetical protein
MRTNPDDQLIDLVSTYLHNNDLPVANAKSIVQTMKAERHASADALVRQPRIVSSYVVSFVRQIQETIN